MKTRNLIIIFASAFLLILLIAIVKPYTFHHIKKSYVLRCNNFTGTTELVHATLEKTESREPIERIYEWDDWSVPPSERKPKPQPAGTFDRQRLGPTDKDGWYDIPLYDN